MWPCYRRSFALNNYGSRLWQSQFSLRVFQVVIRVILSEKTLKVIRGMSDSVMFVSLANISGAAECRQLGRSLIIN